ncbi:ZIP zinc transporter-domain-containing protein [Baffinella frigidus]|nr:ZIP zinc transporter-domain-containing protein [Cryptophyta sp. CCMP2293]
MLSASKVFALALLVVASSCMSDASHNGGMLVRGLRTRPLHVALARTSEEMPVVDHSKVHRQALSLREADEDDDDHHDEHDEHEDDHNADNQPHSEEDALSSVNLRIAAVFITGVTTLAGLLPFLAVSAVPPTLILCVRAASGGTMISLALIHILPEASHSLEDVSPFPLAGTFMAVGVFLSYAVQLAFHRSSTDSTVRAAALPKDVELGPVFTASNDAATSSGPDPSATGPVNYEASAPKASPLLSAEIVHQCCLDTELLEAAAASEAAPEKVAILSMEAGCFVHSVVIGLGLGLNTDYTTTAVLVGVLSIHQFLEGLCLGYLLSGLVSKVEKAVAVILTTLSVPAGATAGLIVSIYGSPASNDAAKSHPALAIVQCLSGGLLLYTTLTNLVGEDLKRDDVLAPNAWRKRLVMGVSFLVGMAAMSGVAAGEAFSGAHAH